MSEEVNKAEANIGQEQDAARENVSVSPEELEASSEAAAERSMHHSGEPGEQHSMEEAMDELELARRALDELKDKHLRLTAEFDNFRKRTAREKLEMMQFASENTLRNLLPVLDDMERAVVNNAKVDDIAAVRQGFELIQQKLTHILSGQGLKAMEGVVGEVFDTDRHEAITKAPAPTPERKGRVIDVVENGYTLHDKVIRYAKVVVGE
jgi:molecular chaperone GrpE